MQGTLTDFQIFYVDYYETDPVVEFSEENPDPVPVVEFSEENPDPVFRKKTMELGFVPKKEWITMMEKFKMKCAHPKDRKKSPVYCKNMKTKHW